MGSSLLKRRPGPLHFCLPSTFWIETPVLRKCEGSTDAKMGARGVEPTHGVTFPTSGKDDSEVNEEPRAGLEEAARAAERCACSTQEPAH